jgi:hypothetical protein
MLDFASDESLRKMGSRGESRDELLLEIRSNMLGVDMHYFMLKRIMCFVVVAFMFGLMVGICVAKTVVDFL